MKNIDIKDSGYVTPKQFAQRYNISIKTQAKFRMEKYRDTFVRYFRFGKTILYKQSDIDEWLERQTIGTSK